MNELSQLFIRTGFVNVKTYIQSGNIVFKSKMNDIPVLNELIHKKIIDQLQIDISVFTFSLQILESIIVEAPYIHEDGFNSGYMYLTFLSSTPDSKNLLSINNTPQDMDKFFVKSNLVYLYCPKGYGNTKFTNSFFERKLKVSATTRNWNTVKKMVGLASEI